METLGFYSDQSRSDARIDSAIAAAEYEQRAVNSHHAATVGAVHTVLGEARFSPEVFVGRHASRSNREHVQFSERAAIADLAVRLALSENTVRAFEQQAVTMIDRTPLSWGRFRVGDISPANARALAELGASLPGGDGEMFAAFDAAVAQQASQLAPARFRAFARKLREQIVSDTADERHESEVLRRVVFEPDIDGMAWISAYLPAEVAAAVMARLDAEVWRATALDGETRSRGSASRCADSDAVTPRQAEMAASLEGYGPIDAETARRLPGDATSIYRILTDPISGAILDIDKPSRHIPAGLRRMRQLIDQTCTFPGCGRRAANCDLGHTVARQFGGRTTLMNLSHLCRNHHRDKHQTKWMIAQSEIGAIEWTSPTGHVAKPDPPPF